MPVTTIQIPEPRILVVDEGENRPRILVVDEGENRLRLELPVRAPKQLFIGPDPPATIAPIYLWIQTDIDGDPDAFTFWFEDGTS